MNQRFRSIALIRKMDEDAQHWLVRWCEPRQQYELIVGERLEKESFRETVVREAGWQLNLDPKRDFAASSMARLSVEYVEPAVDPEQDPEHVAVAFYCLEVYRKSTLDHLANDPKNCWVESSQLCRGVAPDGRPIDPQCVEWINRWKVVQPWES